MAYSNQKVKVSDDSQPPFNEVDTLVNSKGISVRPSLSAFVNDQLSNVALALTAEDKLGIQRESLSPRLSELLHHGADLHRALKNTNVSKPASKLFREDEDGSDEDEDSDLYAEEEIVAVQYLDNEWQKAGHSEPTLHLRQQDVHTESTRVLGRNRQSRIGTLTKNVRSAIGTVFGFVTRKKDRETKKENNTDKTKESHEQGICHDLSESQDHRKSSRKHKQRLRKAEKSKEARGKPTVKTTEVGDAVVGRKTSLIYRIRNSARNLALRVYR